MNRFGLTKNQIERSPKAFKMNPTLLKEIYAYDPECALRIDHKSGCWCLFKRVHSKKYSMNKWYPAIVFQDESGLPLPFDRRILIKMAESDLWKKASSADDLCDQMEAREKAHEEKIDKDFDDDMRHLSRENKRQLDKAYTKHLNETIS